MSDRLRAAAAIMERLAAQASLEAGASEVAAFARETSRAARVEVFVASATGLSRCAAAGEGPAIEVPALDGPARDALAVPGIFVFPLRAGPDTEGVLALRASSIDPGSTGQGSLDEDAREALRLLAAALGLFLARRRQQKEQKILFDSVPAMIWFKDRENRILRCNRMAAQQAGLTPELMEGRRTEEFYPDEAAKYLADDLEVIRSERPKLGIIELHQSGTGEKIWVRTDKIPYRDESGAVTGVVVFATDITQLKRAEEALRAEKERILVTLRSIADAVIATDEQGRVEVLNPVAEALTGWTLEEARGLPLEVVVRTQPDGARAFLLSRSGTRHSVTESRAPITDGEQRHGHVVVLRDVTETARLEQELFKTAKMESIGLLAGGIAHDFNNLLTAVAANASLVRVKGSVPEAAPLLDEIDRAVKQARDLTFQLLTFAKGGAPTRERTLLPAIVTENASLALRGSNVRLVHRFEDDLDAVDVDPGQFAQVIQNLVINAKQAMPQGGIISIHGSNVLLDEARARALRVTPGRFVKLSVEDTGSGIARDDLSKVFDPFFTTKAGGTGLGLTTTFSIVRRHEGGITCDSRLGIGTTFEVFLPSSRLGPRRDSPVTETEVLPRPGSRGRALVMDDQKSVREVLGRMLEHLGLTVAYAADGEEAIAAYEEALRVGRRFDLVFMDLTVPGGMGGKDAVTRILALDANAHVIVSSGYSNDPVMAEHERHGFRGLLAKPFMLDDVERIVARASRREG